MAAETTALDDIVRHVLTASAAEGADAADDAANLPTMRERFFELLVLSLANLHGKTPVASALFDRAMLRSVCGGLDDTEAGKLATRAEDWIRLEGLVRVLEGQKSYTLNRPSLAVLSTPTAHGTLGEVMERIALRYAERPPNPELRRHTRQLAAYFMTRLGRS